MTGRTPSRTCIYGVEQHILCRETPVREKNASFAFYTETDRFAKTGSGQT
jgi:hypothetical protein